MDTAPDLQEAILKNMRHWIYGETIPSTRNPLEIAQDNIGWNYLIEGVVPMYWGDHQQQYYLKKGKTNNGFRWLVLLIRKLWLIA
jgi:hypothetical protein